MQPPPLSVESYRIRDRRSSKLQTPSSRQIPNTKHGKNILSRIWCSGFGASLMFGAWSLELCSSARAAEPAIPKFLGSQSCASAMCHGGADEKHNQFLI